MESIWENKEIIYWLLLYLITLERQEKHRPLFFCSSGKDGDDDDDNGADDSVGCWLGWTVFIMSLFSCGISTSISIKVS